jgi:hypothetical protein
MDRSIATANLEVDMKMNEYLGLLIINIVLVTTPSKNICNAEVHQQLM